MTDNAKLSIELVEDAILNPSLPLTCADLHELSCNHKAFIQFKNSVKSLSKPYLVVHLIPLLFRTKELKAQPAKVLWRFLIGFIRSILSVGINSALIRRLVCVCTALFGFNGHHTIPQGFLSGIALMIETPSRQAEISLYCTCKSIEMAYNVLLRRGTVKGIKYGEAILFGVAMAIIGYYYQNEKQTINRTYLSAFNKTLGEV